MTYDNWRLQTPEEYFGYGCEECPCEDVDDPRPLDEDGEVCGHKQTCGCDGCKCNCHGDHL